MRICVFSERMAPPFDEGIKNYTLHLAHSLMAEHEVALLTAMGHSTPEHRLENRGGNRLLLSPSLARRLFALRPELILYVPTACATLFSFLRARLLKAYGRGAPVVLLAMQPRRYGRLARLLMPHLKPDLILIQSERARLSLSFLNTDIGFFPPGIDMERFRPTDAARRFELRRIYGLRPEDYVLLHVGHLNPGRNVQLLAAMQSMPGNQVVVVGSTSTPHDGSLVHDLREAGVRVISEYLPNIAEIYQLADCYLFPVVAETSCVDVPLSILEAMACDLPVVTTPYGGLPLLFAAEGGFRYAENVADMVTMIEECKRLRWPGTRHMVQEYAWTCIGPWLLDSICRKLGLPRQKIALS